MKKYLFAAILLIGLSANIVLAGGSNCPTQGLVPCGNNTCPCELCDFFIMAQKIINFMLFTIVPAVAVLLVVIAGIFLILGSGYDPSLLSKGKSMFSSIAIGLIITYGSWVIVNLFFVFIGLADVGVAGSLGNKISNWFVFPCP